MINVEGIAELGNKSNNNNNGYQIITNGFNNTLQSGLITMVSIVTYDIATKYDRI